MDAQLQAQAERLAPYLLPLLLRSLYEAGTWTPAFGGTTTDGTLTHNLQEGQYVRVGALVVVTYRVRVSAVTSAPTGNLTVTGLPFAADSATGAWAGPVHAYNLINLAASVVQISGEVIGGESRIQFIESYDNAAPTSVPASAIQANSYVLGAAIYQTI